LILAQCGSYWIADTENTTINQVDAMEERHATTHFSTDAQARTVSPQHDGTTAKFDALSARDWSALSLHELLSQPVPLFSGVADGSFSLGWRSIQEVFRRSQFHLDKVRGYVGIRATVVVRLVVNADKYTQGRLLLAYQPVNPAYSEPITDFRRLTQLTHVELDLNTDTEVVLRIPHRGPYTHFDIAEGRFDPGIFRIEYLLPWAGSPYAYTVYASLEDVHLMGPAGFTTISYESGLQAEEANVPLSTKVKRLGTALTAFGGTPLIGSYISPMAWATAAAGNVLSAFGWSRPLNTKSPEMRLNRLNAKYNHVDGTDYAEQLAITATTGVRATEQIGLTEEDEMSFPFLLGISSAMYRFNYGITTPSGTRILQIPLSPWAMSSPSGVTGANVSHPMFYIANMFHMYRGSLTMTIDLAKTIFHSGRLMVVFEPIVADDLGRTLPASRVNTIADAINCHKDIVDIRKGSTFSFTFPFTAFTPYINVEKPYGYVHVFVLNQLVVNSANVPENISVAVKFKCEEDFEFAGPTQPRFYPYSPEVGSTSVSFNNYNVQAGTPTPATLLGATYESGLEVGDTVIVAKPIGSSSIPSADKSMAELCVGECVRSMKQVAMRMKLVWYDAVTTNNASLRYVFSVDTIKDSAFGQPDSSYNGLFDFYSYVGSMYAYARGGVVLNVANPADLQELTLSMKVDTTSFDDTGKYSGEEWSIVGTVRPESSDRFYIPPYDSSMVRYTEGTLLTGTDNYGTPTQTLYGSSHGFNSTRVRFTINGNATKRGNVSRSAAEDTQFGGFKSVPLLATIEPYWSFDPEVQQDYKLNQAVQMGFPAS
jgi:hypothetical protein